MLDRKSTKKPLDHLRKHLTLTFNSDSDLKDEAYMQVLKQLKDHPEPDNEKRGWNFFSVLASCYAPSEGLYYSILNFLLFEIKHNQDPIIVKRCNYIFLRLVKTYGNPRKILPSDNELYHIEVL